VDGMALPVIPNRFFIAVGNVSLLHPLLAVARLNKKYAQYVLYFCQKTDMWFTKELRKCHCKIVCTWASGTARLKVGICLCKARIYSNFLQKTHIIRELLF